MRYATLVFRGLNYHRLSHLGIFLGTAVTAVVLTGALLVGDSVRHSLSSMASARLGRATHALDAGPRFIAASVSDRLGDRTGLRTAPLLQVRAVALKRGPDGRVAASAGVRLIGVDERFRRFTPPWAGIRRDPPLTEREVLVNGRVARELDLERGDTLTLRIGRTGLMPLDAPLSSRAGKMTQLGSFTVAGVVPPEDLGRFNLRAEQVPPANVFVDLQRLQEMLDLVGKANVILVAAGDGKRATVDGSDIEAALNEVFGIEDAGYVLRRRSSGIAQLESERIFIDPGVGKAALAIPGAAGSLTWLVDSISHEDSRSPSSTPYSFVTAVAPSPVPGMSPIPEGMGDDEIILNSWAARETGAGKGDRVTLEYSVLTDGNAFAKRSRTFTVAAAVPMTAIEGERALVPRFPGLTDVDSCRDWDIGMPLDEKKLADEANEDYWRRYRQTPKAFVTLAAGQEMWSNRWGNLTAVRYPSTPEGTPPGVTLTDIAAGPEAAGYVLLPLSLNAAAAVADSLDFGGLFLGMSFFLIAAALVLTGMLHSFSVQQRTEECGTLLALGFSPRRVALLLFAEGLAVTLAGAGVGSFLGTVYTRSLLFGLGRFWQEAVAGAAISYHGEPATIAAGAAAAFFCSALAVLLTLRSLGKMEVRELLAPGPSPVAEGGPSSAAAKAGVAVALGGSAGAGLLLLYASLAGRESQAPFFFAAGALLLLSFLAGLLVLFNRLDRPVHEPLSLFLFSLKNTVRRRWRSLGVAGTFACGCFIIVSVASMSPDPADGSGRSWSGTGGFTHFGESVLPVLSRDVNGEVKKRASGGTDLPGPFTAVPMKVREGDDASCFNLNRAQSPTLLGVDPRPLAARRSFVPENRPETMWDLLRLDLPAGTVPGLAGDRDTAMWNLAVKAGVEDGDGILYRDEWGREFTVRIVGALPVRKSVLQGSIIIADTHFSRLFPSVEGYRTFLFDAAPGEEKKVHSLLEDTFASEGMDVSTASERLGRFYAVEHTYLKMFFLLGGLGLVLASFGMGVVVLRNMAERRSEHALLSAVGFTRRTLGKLLLLEHASLFAAGVGGGTVAALIAVLPALGASAAGLPLGNLALLAAALLASGFFWIGLAARLGAKKNPIPALQGE